jgi:glycosyltransferase involved in cell wall biosynthesis
MEVSVIIPVFNNVETLERAVNSVINQDRVNEVFIIDDGSTDGSNTLANELAKKNEKVKILYHKDKKNKGATTSRNLGLRHATSDWIQFLDADDEVLPGKLEGQLKIAILDTAIVVGNSIHVYPDGRQNYRKSDQDIWKGLIRSKLGDTCANLWNRKYLIGIDGWDESLGSSQEYDLMFRILSFVPKVVFDSRFLTLIHFSQNSISTNQGRKLERVQNWLGLRERIRLYLKDTKKFDIRCQYYWSGAVGVFCETNNTEFPIHLNKLFFYIYKYSNEFKVMVYHWIKFFIKKNQ